MNRKSNFSDVLSKNVLDDAAKEEQHSMGLQDTSWGNEARVQGN